MYCFDVLQFSFVYYAAHCCVPQIGQGQGARHGVWVCMGVYGCVWVCIVVIRCNLVLCIVLHTITQIGLGEGRAQDTEYGCVLFWQRPDWCAYSKRGRQLCIASTCLLGNFREASL